jgi:hypothetical protein
MLLSTALLERMRNNFMVIEVWDKKTSAENDEVSFIDVIFMTSWNKKSQHTVCTQILTNHNTIFKT